MGVTFTQKVKDEIGHHLNKDYIVDLRKASYDKVEIKKDLRNKFVKCGMVCDPNRSYHFEYRLKDMEIANQTLQELSIYGISGKLSVKKDKKGYIVYIVDLKNILSILKLLGANKTYKEYKVVADYREARRETNRQVNFEIANIKKVAKASLNQVETIKKLSKKVDIESLDKDLRVFIKARLKYPLLSLNELAEKMGNVSKSVLNHRMIKIRKLLGE